ncbi:LysR substrate binding domain protein [compost metagenome]
MAALEPGCTYRRVAERWARSTGTITTTQVSSYHAILASVAAGDAIGVVPRSVFDLMDWPGKVGVYPLREVQTLLVCRAGARSAGVDILHQALLANPGAPKH